MKKLIGALAVLTISTSSVGPVLTTLTQQNLNRLDAEGNYNAYQVKEDWETYMTQNQGFIDLIKDSEGIGSEYQYKSSELVMETIENNQPVGTLLMNSKIETTVGSPSMASQHIIDNSQGPNPITVNYDSKTVTNTSTISASFTVDVGASITAKEEVNLFFVNSSISATLSFNTSISSSTTSSVEQTVTFDKFSTTVNPGDKVEVDYLVMQNLQTFNMVLKTKLDLSKCKFNFTNSSGAVKSVVWSELAKNKNNSQNFAREVSNSLSPSEIRNDVQPLLSVERINDPTVSKDEQVFNPNIIYIYLPLSFTVDGYSTLITQSKI